MKPTLLAITTVAALSGCIDASDTIKEKMSQIDPADYKTAHH
ncbi:MULTISPECIES: hypothetical protein [Vibrio]|nr:MULTISPECIES: hypothetical protein [Vibrio]